MQFQENKSQFQAELKGATLKEYQVIKKNHDFQVNMDLQNQHTQQLLEQQMRNDDKEENRDVMKYLSSEFRSKYEEPV